MRRVSLETALGIITTRLGFHLRDEGLLESALARPVTVVHGRSAYGDLALAAAAQTESSARNHPLIDGNKRTALALLHVFLRLNGVRLVCSNDSIVEYMVSVAEGSLALEDSADFIRRSSRPWS